MLSWPLFSRLCQRCFSCALHTLAGYLSGSTVEFIKAGVGHGIAPRHMLYLHWVSVLQLFEEMLFLKCPGVDNKWLLCDSHIVEPGAQFAHVLYQCDAVLCCVYSMMAAGCMQRLNCWFFVQ
jgi:hypothetical protein